MGSQERGTQVLDPEMRLSPYYPATQRAGATLYAAYNRVYWPVAYRHDAGEALKAIMERVIMMDVGCERPTEIQGRDALRFTDYLCTRDLSTLGADQCRHTAVCDGDGVIYCEAMVLRPSEDTVWVFNGPVDFLYWAQAIALHTDYDVTVRDTTVAPIALQGPASREMMREIVPDAADLKFYRWVRARLANQECIIARTGWSGQFGYEIFPLDSPNALPVWEYLEEAGKRFGLLVGEMTGPYFERGVTDITYGWNLGLNPFEARLGRVVDLDEGEFIGRAALVRAAEQGVSRQLIGLRFPGGALPAMEWFWRVSDEQGDLGVMVDGKDSPILNEMLGYGVLDVRAQPGDRVSVHLPDGSTAPAVLAELPFMT
jgi:aminomethyltransferase